jgi:hypothetical protein
MKNSYKKLFFSLIMKNLTFLRYKTYNSNQDTWNNIIIKNIIFNEKSRLVSSFKDYLIYDDDSEFLKKYYSIDESHQKMLKILCCNNNILIPKYTYSSESKIISQSFKSINIYINRKNENKKYENNFNTINIKVNNKKIFNQKLIEEINKIKPLKSNFIDDCCKDNLLKIKILNSVISANKNKVKPKINFKSMYKTNYKNLWLLDIRKKMDFKEDILQSNVLNALKTNKNDFKVTKSLNDIYTQLKVIFDKIKSIHTSVNINNKIQNNSKIKLSSFVNLKKYIPSNKNIIEYKTKKSRIFEKIPQKENKMKTIEINDLSKKYPKTNAFNFLKNIRTKNKNFKTEFKIKKLNNINLVVNANNSSTISKCNKNKSNKKIKKENTIKFKTIPDVKLNYNSKSYYETEINKNPNNTILPDENSTKGEIFNIYHKLVKMSKNKITNKNKIINLKDNFIIEKNKIKLKPDIKKDFKFMNKTKIAIKSPLILSFDSKFNFYHINQNKIYPQQNNQIKLNNFRTKSNTNQSKTIKVSKFLSK